MARRATGSRRRDQSRPPEPELSTLSRGRGSRTGNRARRWRPHLRAVFHRTQGRHRTRTIHCARTLPAQPRHFAVRAARRRRQRLQGRVQRSAALGGIGLVSDCPSPCDAAADLAYPLAQVAQRADEFLVMAPAARRKYRRSSGAPASSWLWPRRAESCSKLKHSGFQSRPMNSRILRVHCSGS